MKSNPVHINDTIDPLSTEISTASCGDHDPDPSPATLAGSVQTHGAVLVLDPDSLTIRWYSLNLQTLLGSEPPALSSFHTTSPPTIAHLLATEFSHPGWNEIVQLATTQQRIKAACTPKTHGARIRLLATVRHLGHSVIVDLEPASASRTDVDHDIHQMLMAIFGATDVDELGGRVTRILQQATGVDRVLLGRLVEGHQTETIAVSHSSGPPPLTERFFPSVQTPLHDDSAPQPNRCRIVFDGASTPVALAAASADGGGLAPELTHSALCAPTAAEIESLRSFNARAFVVASLHSGGQLWGQIVCLHDSPLSLGANDRELIETVAAAAGGHIASLERNLHQRERALENRLMQAQQMEGLAMLAGGVAHDFNNLLVGIRCNAELVVSDATELGDDMREALQDVIAASEVASDLTRQLLAYAGRGRGSVQRLDLVALIRQLKPLARVAFHRIEPIIECDEDKILIAADATQIRQIILNVLVNAMEAVDPTHGRITVRVRRTHVKQLERDALRFDAFKREESLAAIEIEDNGCGMDAETLARVLEPFFSTRFTGRGLGLAAVVGAVRVHSGGIGIRSTPGRGTTMTIYLPALTATESSEHMAAVTGSSHVILLGPFEELDEIAAALEASVGIQTRILQSIQDVVSSRDALGTSLKAAVIHHDSDMGRDLRAAQFLRSQSPDLMIIQLGGEREPGSGAVSVVMEKWNPAAVVRIVQERLNLEHRLT